MNKYQRRFEDACTRMEETNSLAWKLVKQNEPRDDVWAEHHKACEDRDKVLDDIANETHRTKKWAKRFGLTSLACLSSGIINYCMGNDSVAEYQSAIGGVSLFLTPFIYAGISSRLQNIMGSFWSGWNKWSVEKDNAGDPYLHKIDLAYEYERSHPHQELHRWNPRPL
jgi:hypothetical protein